MVYSTMSWLAALVVGTLSSPSAASWRVISKVDPMTGKPAAIAPVSAGSATLQLACKRTGPELVFSGSVAVRTVGLSYRFDDGPVVPRVAAVVGSDFRRVYPWLGSPTSGTTLLSSSHYALIIWPQVSVTGAV